MEYKTALRPGFTKTVLAFAGIAVAVALITGMVDGPVARAQPRTAFEVASIKTAVTPGRGAVICFVPCTPGERLTVQGNRVDIRNMSITALLVRAYRIKPFQLSGPEWMRSTRFDIMAKTPEGVPAERLPEMLQTLLAERFKLTMHRETKEQPVYALVTGKNGIKLEPARPEAGIQRPVSSKARPMFTPDGDAHMDAGGITITSGRFGPMRSLGGGKWEMAAVTMPALAEFVGPHEDRPVIDGTNLPGAYRFVFGAELEEGSRGEEGNRTANSPPGTAEDRWRASMMQALEKGGLKLERRNAPIERFLVDHVERTPTAN